MTAAVNSMAETIQSIHQQQLQAQQAMIDESRLARQQQLDQQGQLMNTLVSTTHATASQIQGLTVAVSQLALSANSSPSRSDQEFVMTEAVDVEESKESKDSKA